jgi:GntR family transcriptional regulator
MTFRIDFHSGTPVYLQLVDQVRHLAASGAVRAGDALPGIRPLAEELRINRNTVAKAYAELESQGLIETMPGKGCFVRATSSPYRKDVRRRRVADTLDTAVVHAHHLQIGRDEFLRLAEERFDALDAKRTRAAGTTT